MESIEECIRLFGGQVVEVRYTDEAKKRLMNYLKWKKEKGIVKKKLSKYLNEK